MAYNSNYTKDVNVEVSEDKLSRINAAGLINITMENLWKDAFNSMAKGDLVTWNRKLDAIWLILVGDVDKKKDEYKHFERINILLYTSGNLSHKKIGFQKQEKGESEIIGRQYQILMKKSEFLMTLRNSQGKGTAYADGDESDWE